MPPLAVLGISLATAALRLRSLLKPNSGTKTWRIMVMEVSQADLFGSMLCGSPPMFNRKSCFAAAAAGGLVAVAGAGGAAVVGVAAAGAGAFVGVAVGAAWQAVASKVATAVSNSSQK